MREHALRPIRHHGADRMVQRAIVKLIFLAVSNHHRALVGLANGGQGMRQERHGALGHHDLPSGRSHRRRQADHRRERLVGVAGGEHDLAGADLALRCRQPEFAAAPGDRRDRPLRKIVDAEQLQSRVEGAKSAQRIHVPVQRTEAAARHLGSDQRQHLSDFRRRQHRHPVVSRAHLVVHACHKLSALRELVLAQRQVKAAILLQGDVEPGLIFQFGG